MSLRKETEFLIDEQVDKVRLQEENERVLQLGRQPAKSRPLLLGITKASLGHPRGRHEAQASLQPHGARVDAGAAVRRRNGRRGEGRESDLKTSGRTVRTGEVACGR